MQDKEQQYKELLVPLVKEIYEMAQELQLPLLLAVQVNDDMIRSSGWIPADASEALHMASDIVQGYVQVVEAPVAAQPTGRLQA